MGKQWKQWQTLFWGDSKITGDGDCTHEIQSCLLPGRKAMTNLDSTLKSRDITLLSKVHLVKAMVFPVVMFGCESWTIKKAEHLTIDAFELLCWRRLLRVPWTARRSNRSILKEISPEYSLEGLMLSWSCNILTTWCEELTHWKRPWCWERLMAAEEQDDRGLDGWMASPTQWTRVWVKLQELVTDREAWRAAVHGLQRVGHNWAIELNWRRCIEKGSLLHSWCECKLMQLLWKTVQRFLENLKIGLPCDSAISLLDIYPEKTKTLIQKDTCIYLVFTAALFTIAKTWKQPNHSSTDG